MIAEGVEELSRRLKEGGYHLTIETAATVWKDVVCDLASLSPKLGSSTPWTRAQGRHADAHEDQRLNFDTIRRLMSPPETKRREIGFHVKPDDDAKPKARKR